MVGVILLVIPPLKSDRRFSRDLGEYTVFIPDSGQLAVREGVVLLSALGLVAVLGDRKHRD